jgi:NAD-dependent SIR2 family protein deacetylase
MNLDVERSEKKSRLLAVGPLRRGIVYYGGGHPAGDTIAQIQEKDLNSRPDFFIILGTSLKIPNLKSYVRKLGSVMPREAGLDAPSPRVILVDLTPPNSDLAGVIDVHVKGEIDIWVSHVMDYAARNHSASAEGRFSALGPSSEIKRKKSCVLVDVTGCGPPDLNVLFSN